MHDMWQWIISSVSSFTGISPCPRGSVSCRLGAGGSESCAGAAGMPDVSALDLERRLIQTCTSTPVDAEQDGAECSGRVVGVLRYVESADYIGALRAALPVIAACTVHDSVKDWFGALESELATIADGDAVRAALLIPTAVAALLQFLGQSVVGPRQPCPEGPVDILHMGDGGRTAAPAQPSAASRSSAATTLGQDSQSAGDRYGVRGVWCVEGRRRNADLP